LTKASGICCNNTMQQQKMLTLRLQGHTYNHIANLAGISRQRVQQLLSPPKAIRDFVVNKYAGRCDNCSLYIGRRGHVHHKANDGELYNDIENLQLLCLSCHRKAHKNDYVIPLIQRKRNANIIKCRQAGMTLRMLGSMFNLSHTQIANICKDGEPLGRGGHKIQTGPSD